MENVFTDVKGLAWAETRQWRRGLDPTKPPTPLSPPSLPRKRESFDIKTRAKTPRKPAPKKKLPSGGDKGGGKSGGKSGDKKPVKAANKKVQNLKPAATLSDAKSTAAEKKIMAAEKEIMAEEEDDEEDDPFAADYEAETETEYVDTCGGPPEFEKRVGKPRDLFSY